MPVRIHFNEPAYLSQLHLIRTDRELGRSMERLASGERILNAADDPAGMTLANGMRFHLSGLDAAGGNLENGINLLQTADGGMGEITAALQEMRALAVEAANEGVNDVERLRALQNDLNELIASIDRVAGDTRFAGIQLLDGNLADNTLDRDVTDTLGRTAADYYRSFTQDDAVLHGSVVEGSTLRIQPPSGDLDRSYVQASFTLAGSPPAATDAVQGCSQGGTVLSNLAGGTITVDGPDGSRTIATTATMRFVDLVSLINAASGETGARAAYDEDTGAFTVEAIAFGAATLNLAATDMSGGANVGFLDDDTTDPAANGYVTTGTNRTVDVIYDNSLTGTQVATLTQDPSMDDGLCFTDGAFRLIMRDGTDGALGGTVTVPTREFTAERFSTKRVHVGTRTGDRRRLEIPDLHAAALAEGTPDLLNAGLRNLAELRNQTALVAGDAQDAIRIVDRALAEVDAARGRTGSLQAASLEAGLDFLRVSMENLGAAESRIRDTDFAFESAEYTRLRIRYQAATAMLGQANNVAQSVLELLQ